MKIAIHHNHESFSDRWIEFCEKRNIPYKLVDCYASDIIRQLSDCDALMWHFHQASPKDTLFAKQLMFSVQASGKKIFPDFYTAWHFDDKVGQKYLLEAIDAPLVPSYVFYEKKEALEWVKGTSFPKVFKLRGGAGSQNVKLVRTKDKANRLIRRAFRSGFSQYNAISNLKDRVQKYRSGKTNLWDVVKGLVRIVYPTEFEKVAGNEKGYIYFQDYIPGNDSDIRIIVINNRAYALKRMVRKNDFRASGSGFILYEKELIDEKAVKIAFEISKKLNFQCMAYDFLFMKGDPLIIEISYGFAIEAYDPCPGFWDSDMQWHQGVFNPQEWMVELVLESERNQ